MHQFLALVTLPLGQLHLLQRTVLVERHRCVEEKVVVRYVIHAAVTKQYVDVLAQFLAHHKRMVQLAHQFLLLRGEGAGVLGVDGGEQAALHLVPLAVHHARAFFVVNGVEQRAVFHAPLRMPCEHRRLHLELYHGYRLVHHGAEARRLLVDIRRASVELGYELLAGVVGVGLHGERGERHEVDAVAVFERRHVGVSQREAYHVADARVVAGARPHPQYVVVAPLNVPVVVVLQHIHYTVRPGASVVDVAQDMQLVNGEPLYHL